MNRREFAVRALALAAAASTNIGWRLRPDHPEPRPGITADKVLKDEDVTNPKAKESFAMVREIPHIIDGIRCPCDCGDKKGYYSLLSCFEGEGMAQKCGVCYGAARVAYLHHKKGESLDQIRAAVDKAYQ
jgi:hypothetical protein